MMSSATGFDFAGQIDACGGILWIWHVKASAANEGVQRADLDRLRNDLFANQERQFANIVGVVRTLLHESDELVLAMGRVPKSDRATRAFDTLRLSEGNESRESQG